MDCATFLFIRHASQSLSSRLYLEQFGSESFLHWWLARFRSRHPESTLGIVTTSEAEGEYIRSAGACLPWVVLFCSAQVNKTSALAEAAGQSKRACIAVCGFEYAFAPPGLLDLLLSHHERCRNSYTLVRGLPARVAPEVFETELLTSLSQLGLPNLPSEPAKALEQLRGLGATGLRIPLALRHQPFDAGAAYGDANKDLPDHIDLKNAGDLQLARSTIEQSLLATDPLSELRSWRQRLAARHEDLRRRAMLVADSVAAERKLNDPPRVLFISNPSAFSGAEESLSQLASHIDNGRFRLFAVIGAEGMFTSRLRQAGVRVTCPGYGFGSTPTERAVYLSEVISRVSPDIVHLNGMVGTEIWMMLLLLRIPLITHYRVSEISIYADQLRISASVVAVSGFCRRQAIQCGVNESRVHVVYDEVDTTEFSPNFLPKFDARKQMGLPPDAFVVLMIARFAPNKRHELLLRAAEIVRSQIPNLSLVLKGESFGEGTILDDVQGLIRSHGLTDCVTILPFVDDIRVCHAAADVLVLCSDREALGRCVVESMAMGRPVIVTDSGGTHELVRNGVTGLIVPGDGAGLARALLEAFHDPRWLDRAGLSARAFACENLDARISAKQVMAIYDSVLAERPVPASFSS